MADDTQERTAADAPVRLDIVSDVICPWCFIGKRHLEQAAAERPDLNLDIHWRTFQLNPDMPAEGMSRDEYMRAKFGDAAGGQMYDRVRQAGANAGIGFDFEAIQHTPNTVNAHRLIAIAGEHDCQDAVVEALFKAYFLDGRNIGDPTVLAAVAEEANMPAEAIAQWQDDAKRQEVLGEDRVARSSGVQGVPCFIIDQRYAVSGAQPAAVLLEVLDRAVAERAAAE